MSLASYRKYRPLKFADVINQDHVKVTLANSVANNRAGHAYLFTGPRGVGKTTLARIFARALNCPNVQNGEPCNTCDLCIEFLNNTSLDLMEIDAASHTGVDNIRELIEHLQFVPTRAKFKVIIIDEVHMLSKGAFNALLKTLEEPPKHAVFVLATTEIHKVPATIVSRSQRFDFRKATLSDLVAALKRASDDSQIKISPDALLSIASAADGSFRDSLSLMDQVSNFAQGEITAELAEDVLGLTSIKTTSDYFDLILQKDSLKAVNYIAQLTMQGRDLYQFQKDFLEYLRKLLLLKLGSDNTADYTTETREKMQKQIFGLEVDTLLRLLDIYQKSAFEIKNSTIPSLPLEIASVEATQLGLPKTVRASQIEPAGSTIPEQVNDSPEILEKVIASWDAVLEKVKEYNHSLISSLKLAIPSAVQGQHLVLIIPYKFHKDAIDARKNRIVIDQVLEEVLGIKLFAKPLLQKEWLGGVAAPVEAELDKKAENNQMVESALKIMGGEMEKK